MGSSAIKGQSDPEKVAELNNQHILSQYDKQEDSKESNMTPEERRAFGAILGAFTGDALGAFLEFKKSVTDAELEAALKMQGGGVMRTGAGQVTDDSEMAMCLLQALGRVNGLSEDVLTVEDAATVKSEVSELRLERI